MDNLEYQIGRLALPCEGFYGAVWQTYSVSSGGLPIWENACFPGPAPLIKALRVYPAALSVKNLYVTHSIFKAPDYAKPRNPPRLNRRIDNLLATRALVIDGDVKTGAFSSTVECKRTICAMLAEIGLAPSFIVLTSAPLDPARPVETSGMHIYLTMTRAPSSLADWKAMALNLVAILKHRGLVFDTGVTTDPVRIVRSIGSLNRKLDEVRVARLDLESVEGPDYDPGELKSVLERNQPPDRGHNGPPPDYNTHVDLAEAASAAEYLLERGHYGPGRYFNLRDLFFGLAQAAYDRSDLHEDIRALFERIAVATGRDHARAMSWFDGAVARAPGYVAQSRVTLATTFKAAYEAGWSSSPELDDGQYEAVKRARSKLNALFDADDYERDDAAKQAQRISERIRDPAVRVALAPTLAVLLARDGWDESKVLDAIETLTGRRNAGLAHWAKRRAA